MSRSRWEPMPARFNALATYNGERSRGIVHTAEWDAQMAVLQQEFRDWQDTQNARQEWLSARGRRKPKLWP